MDSFMREATAPLLRRMELKLNAPPLPVRPMSGMATAPVPTATYPVPPGRGHPIPAPQARLRPHGRSACRIPSRTAALMAAKRTS
jgi:hypothetical protein